MTELATTMDPMENLDTLEDIQVGFIKEIIAQQFATYNAVAEVNDYDTPDVAVLAAMAADALRLSYDFYADALTEDKGYEFDADLDLTDENGDEETYTVYYSVEINNETDQDDTQIIKDLATLVVLGEMAAYYSSQEALNVSEEDLVAAIINIQRVQDGEPYSTEINTEVDTFYPEAGGEFDQIEALEEEHMPVVAAAQTRLAEALIITRSDGR